MGRDPEGEGVMVKRIDSDHGPRLYEIPAADGEGTIKVPSVTSVLAMIAKPQLVAWAAKMERTLVVSAAADLYEDLPPAAKRMGRMAYVNTLEKRIPLAKAHQVATEKAFETGRQAHEMVEWTLRKQLGHVTGDMPGMNEDAAFAFAAYEQWADEAEFKPERIEEVLFSSEFGYAGTCDVVGEIEVEGAIVKAVGDWKTSKAIYDEYGLQVAAYAHALHEMGHVKEMPYGFVARFPKTRGDQPFQTRLWTPAQLNENLRVFLCLLQVWRWHQTLEKPKRSKKEAATS